MKNIAEFLELFMDKTGYPEDAKDDFRRAHNAVLADADANAEFDNVYRRFTDDEDESPIFPAIDALGEQIGVHPYTMDLYMFMYEAYFLRERYAQKGINEQIFWDSMTDLRAKLVECRAVYGINGTFVGNWFFGFFEMTRFALGRLQFERTDYRRDEPYICGKGIVRNGGEMVNMHIPSLGPLTEDKILDALQRAYNFPYFADLKDPETGLMPFCCGSWLLYPPHYDFLPQKSNILKFMDCFDILHWEDADEFSDAWRVFGKDKDALPQDLPRDTSLRRAFADRLIAGQKTGHGFGAFFFDGEKILHNHK